MFPRNFLLSLSLVLLSATAWGVESVTIPAPEVSPPSGERPMPPGTGPLDANERLQLLQKAQALSTQAADTKAAADARYATAQTECWKKTFVSSCLDDVKLAWRKEIELVRQYEREARTIERDVKKHDAAEHAAKRDADNAQRDAEMEKRAAEYRAAEEAKQTEKKK